MTLILLYAKFSFEVLELTKIVFYIWEECLIYYNKYFFSLSLSSSFLSNDFLLCFIISGIIIKYDIIMYNIISLNYFT